MRKIRRRDVATLADVLAGVLATENMPSVPEWEHRYQEEIRRGRFSGSMLKGLLLLAHLLSGEPVGVNDLATRLQLSQSTTHRYLVTLVCLGLVDQEPKTRKYRLAL